jgi:hypothetical protein
MTPDNLASLNPWQLRAYMQEHDFSMKERKAILRLWFKYNRITIIV